MGANSNQILHVDTRNFPTVDTEDLNYFQIILEDIIEDHEPVSSLPASEREYLRVHLAAAIFKSAESGERDYTQLKRSAIEAVSAAPSSNSGS